MQEVPNSYRKKLNLKESKWKTLVSKIKILNLVMKTFPSPNRTHLNSNAGKSEKD